jgi:hypothetical protein
MEPCKKQINLASAFAAEEASGKRRLVSVVDKLDTVVLVADRL